MDAFSGVIACAGGAIACYFLRRVFDDLGGRFSWLTRAFSLAAVILFGSGCAEHFLPPTYGMSIAEHRRLMLMITSPMLVGAWGIMRLVEQTENESEASRARSIPMRRLSRVLFFGMLFLLGYLRPA